MKQDTLCKDLCQALQAEATEEKKLWFERYLRYAVKYRGLPSPQIKTIITGWRQKHQLDKLSPEKQLQLISRLWDSDYAEDKFAATLYIQLFLLKLLSPLSILAAVEEAFERKHFYDWSTVDWLCMRALAPLARSSAPAAKKILSWHKADYLWQARASLVPFATTPFMFEYVDQALRACDVLIRRDERFAKTAVGWFLRVLSRFEPQLVMDKLAAYEDWTTPEVVKNATKYFKQK